MTVIIPRLYFPHFKTSLDNKPMLMLQTAFPAFIGYDGFDQVVFCY